MKLYWPEFRFPPVNLLIMPPWRPRRVSGNVVNIAQDRRYIESGGYIPVKKSLQVNQK